MQCFQETWRTWFRATVRTYSDEKKKRRFRSRRGHKVQKLNYLILCFLSQVPEDSPSHGDQLASVRTEESEKLNS